jgi:hypothetical protein
MFELKYRIENKQIVKKSNGVPIPENEPLFILRAKDKNALPALMGYLALCDDLHHREEVMKSIVNFKQFSVENSEIMKEPTT